MSCSDYYVDRNGLAVILAAKRSAGVTPEVDLGNLLHAGNKACERESTMALKPRADITRSPKQEYQWPTKRTDVLQIQKKINIANL